MESTDCDLPSSPECVFLRGGAFGEGGFVEVASFEGGS